MLFFLQTTNKLPSKWLIFTARWIILARSLEIPTALNKTYCSRNRKESALWGSDRAYMKKEAVTTRPIASMNTDRVGYHASGTGLVIGFGASKNKKQTEMDLRNRKLKKTLSATNKKDTTLENVWESRGLPSQSVFGASASRGLERRL
jgi:hypothetical protein